MDNSTQLTPGKFLGFVPNTEPRVAGLGFQQLVTCVCLLLPVYAFLVSQLRFRYLQRLYQKYPYTTRESFSRMTDDEACEIQKGLVQLEFPFLYLKSLQFALFRTYGIPTISTVLTNTAQFSKPETSLKRYADTVALVQEFVGHAPTSRRACTSIARTRWIHSSYRASGKILEDDMLYTLGLFAIQPVRFVKMYEWRDLSDLERCAIGTFWKSLGDSLNISYDALPSGKTGFRDGLHWLEEIMAWSDDYEVRCMVPHVKNREVAEQTIAVLLYMLPQSLQFIGMRFVSFMMDDRLRKAMLIDPPPAFDAKLFSLLFSARRFALRYLALPRPYFLRYVSYTDDYNESGRIYMTNWDAAPYYVEPSFRNRWGPVAWLTWVLGRPLPGDEGDKYYPKGYDNLDVGPKYFEGKGRQGMEDIMKELETTRRGQCPFH
ncbi:similar to An08g03170 [Aspergillus niger]|uniref:Similar to An08g03170 n=1 Tax=Aspergillus niger TaxID=5061 RepID=A0A100IHZ9_ASPNG|nr:similar to An08g03170 [Aspergillus niger]